MQTRPNPILLVAVVVFAVMLSACGGSDATTVAASDTTAETASAEAASDDRSDSSSSDSGDRESPIAELLGIPISDDDALEQYFGELQRDAEVKIAECMRSQGFEYELVDYSGVTGVAADLDEDTKEYAEEWGFGISSNPFAEAVEAAQTGFDDPNAEYVDSLSEGERDAYMEALQGDMASFFGAGDGDAGGPVGCQGQAFEQVFSFFQVFEEFGDELDAIGDAYDADPRIVAAQSGWSSCMSGLGYSFSDQDSAEADIRRRYQTIINSPDAFEEDSEFSEVQDEAGDVMFFGGSNLKPEFQAEVDELSVEERAIATASWECNGPLREISGDIEFEYEQKFVDQNGAAVRAALDGE